MARHLLHTMSLTLRPVDRASHPRPLMTLLGAQGGPSTKRETNPADHLVNTKCLYSAGYAETKYSFLDSRAHSEFSASSPHRCPEEGLLPLRKNRPPVSPAGRKRQLEWATRSYQRLRTTKHNWSAWCQYDW